MLYSSTHGTSTDYHAGEGKFPLQGIVLFSANPTAELGALCIAIEESSLAAGKGSRLAGMHFVVWPVVYV